MSEFRGILKATAIFGSVQFYTVLMQLIRTKVVAVLLGPSGVGTIGLISSTITLISSFTELGIKNACVREVAKSKNKKKLIRTSKSVAFITGIFGSVITILCSKKISQYLFDNNDWTIVFVSLGIVIFFTHNSNVNLAIIQGLQRKKIFAKINIIVGLLSTSLSLLFYYFFGVNGVIGALLSTSIITYSYSMYYTFEGRISREEISSLWVNARPLLLLGLSISIAGIAANVSNYTIRLLVSKFFSEEQLGFYTSSSSLINSYFGLILAAMAMDFFPRISQVSSQKHLKKITEDQILIALSLIVPLLIGLISFMGETITLLYSSSFLPMTYLSSLFAVGAVLKIVGWALGYVLLTKGAGKFFLLNEIVGCFFQICFAFYFIEAYGFDGLGYALILSNLLYAIQTAVILRFTINFRLGNEMIGLTLSLFLLVFLWHYLVALKFISLGFQILILFLSAIISFVSLYNRSK